MTKRWERELRRLDDVDAPTERIRAHAADRPTDPSHGDGLPPRRQRITAGVVAVVVFVAAGTFAWQAFQPEGGDHGELLDTEVSTQPVSIVLSVAVRGGYTYPTASMEVGGSSIHGVVTSYGWDGAIVDTATPEFSSDDYVPITLPAEMEFVGDALDASVKLHPADDASADPFWIGDGIDIGWMHDQPLPMPSVMGRSVIEVRVKWPQGNPSFYFPVEFVDEAQSTGSQAVLSFVAKNAPEGTLSVDDEEQSGTRSEYDWCDGSGGCVNGIADFASYPPVSKFIEIPGGSLIELEGPVVSMKSQFRTMDGGQASATFEDPIVLVAPNGPGRYALETHVGLDGDDGAHGSATFWFGVEVVATQDSVVPSPALDAAPSTGEIRCLPDGSTVVTTPQVAARADGIHIELREASGATGVEVFKALSNGVHGTGWGPGQHPEVILPVPIGRSRIACAWPDGDDPTSRDEFAASQPIEFVDPGGFYHLDELPCDYEERTYPDDPAYGAYVEGNDQVAMPEVIRRAVPGILPTDVVQYAGYPEAEDAFRQWAVTREGQLVSLVRDPRPLQGVWRFGPLETCGDAGIGTGDSTAGLVGSPFAVPDYSRCDPYATDCVVAYVEEHAYRLLGGEDSNPPSLGDFQGCYEDYVFPVDCAGQPGGTLWVALRLSPTDQASFVDRFGCGASPADLCRESDVEPR